MQPSIETYARYFEQEIQKFENIRSRIVGNSKGFLPDAAEAVDRRLYEGIADAKIVIRRINLLMERFTPLGESEISDDMIPKNEREDVHKMISATYNKLIELSSTHGSV